MTMESDPIARIDPERYDDGATDFVAHMEAGPYNVLYERPAIRELIGDVDGLRVLDVACGAGPLVQELTASGADVVGSDGSSEMLRLARERVGPEIDLHHQDCCEPFTWAESASFDLVVMSLAYHYLNDPVAFLREMHRVLRADGAFIMSTHHPTDDWRRLGGSYFTTELNTDTWKAINQDVVAWRMPLSTITHHFQQAGFLIEQLIEPRPTEQMAAVEPDVFAKLEDCPAFILFRLEKRDSGV